jgi:hypothetical protein
MTRWKRRFSCVAHGIQRFPPFSGEIVPGNHPQRFGGRATCVVSANASAIYRWLDLWTLETCLISGHDLLFFIDNHSYIEPPISGR